MGRPAAAAHAWHSVDLILRAVQPEADRTLGGAAVDVIGEKVCTFWATAAPFLLLTGAAS